MTAPVRVVIADDHPLFREGLAAALGRAGAVVTGQSASVDELLAPGLLDDADVLLLDVSFPDGNGINTLPRLLETHPTLAVLVLTSSDSPETVRAALRAGARGYLVKGTGGDDVARAVAAAAAGQTVLGGAVAAAVIGALDPAGRGDPRLEPLAARDRELLELVAQGLGTDAMARRLSVTPKTVRNQLVRIYSALGVDNRAAAVAAARDLGLGGRADRSGRGDGTDVPQNR